MFNLVEDLRDRLLIPQAFDKISPGVVVWRRVSKPKEGKGENLDVYVSVGAVGEVDEDLGMQSKGMGVSRFEVVENTNCDVDLAMGSSWHIVGIQGADIVNGIKTI